MKDVGLYHDDNEFVLLSKYEKLEKQLKEAEKVIDFYADKTNWMKIIDGKYNLGKIWVYVDYENRFIDNSITTENGKKARKYKTKYTKNEQYG